MVAITFELVPETGIEPVRPLLTKAADFKSTVLYTILNTAGSLAQPQKTVHNICVSKLKNRVKTVFSTLLGGAGKNIWALG